MEEQNIGPDPPQLGDRIEFRFRPQIGSAIEERKTQVSPRQIPGVSDSPTSGVITIDITALAQQWITRHLPAAEIQEISALASAVIGDANKAMQWLSQPNLATDNRAPIDLIGEQNGYERVKSLLLRVEYGVLA